ncbi:hypothetical protein LTR91_025024 [Friedmanniomyces endolithicus]|uniref:Transcription factor domain-containing protein n=1 Tax=Friedmanniomyces endolithicus TaxID=329885 RepID=A0AAN6JWY3_9PEZI|nr:hypothetical protein LTR94_014292 [Friedmanniomyces endolithicus]KAK0777202.1 hypothetical protein LTR59_013927 [Friedmanniomyces endolithicus]KAK0797350.1 hypothetical protein LTR38_008253 [Friedmanniomyces endolithicus]KAK0813952.1 hypothetical protein LTR75_004407 [Friedmanniomyces endolithicus]KAK0837741.1 hypothetical protein LTR03_012547 [Friedmanniomyces endolithicus]
MGSYTSADAQRLSASGPTTSPWDNLPAFTTLTSDEERERKAETQRPGTFAVVATPDSFSSLPEYASAMLAGGRRPSVQSTQGSVSSPTSSSGWQSTRPDPNTVVLERFEDGAPLTTTSYSVSVPPQRSDVHIPDAMRYLSIRTSPQVASLPNTTATYTRIPSSDDHLTAHFRQNIVRRLIQPQVPGQSQHRLVPGSTRDVFELEAARFRPLHHAVCALSALNLSYSGRVSLEEALQHYQDALSVASSPSTADGMLSDGAFLTHFLLFVNDICVPMDADHGGDVMWAQHLNHLRYIAVQRHNRLGREPYGYILWSICELDMYACLLGSGSCDFARTIIENDMLPSLEAQIPATATTSPCLQSEVRIFPMIQRLNEGVVLNAIKVAQHAQQYRTTSHHPSPGATARLQASVSRLQSDLLTHWSQAYPAAYLGPESPQAGFNLPPRVRYVFEHAYLLHQATLIYSRTSMFAAQRSIPVANQGDVHADTERRCIGILTLASSYMEAEPFMELRHAVFPVLMAGIATTQPDAKIQAMNIIKAMESPARGGIGQNTVRTRQLLAAVCEEQRRVVGAGGKIEQVDWLALARERGLSVVNCGL